MLFFSFMHLLQLQITIIIIIHRTITTTRYLFDIFLFVDPMDMRVYSLKINLNILFSYKDRFECLLDGLIITFSEKKLTPVVRCSPLIAVENFRNTKKKPPFFFILQSNLSFSESIHRHV